MAAASQLSLLDKIREETHIIYDQQGFLTEQDITKIWSEARRTQILLDDFLGFSGSKTPTEQTSFLNARLKILLILNDIHWSSWDKCFGVLTNERVDKRLPLKKENLDFLQLNMYINPFYEHQWRFLPPPIYKELDTQVFPWQMELPFHKATHRVIGKGSSGRVTEESIPPGYFRCVTGGVIQVNRVSTKYSEPVQKGHWLTFTQEIKRIARKVFTRTEYATEIKNLLDFHKSRNQHDCIMNFLAFLAIDTKEGEKEYSILMDVADSDLQHFLPYSGDTVIDVQDWSAATMKTLSSTNATTRDLLSEMAELAGALEWLHENIQVNGEVLSCCHMDLKPSNILMFDIDDCNPVGKWKIADFGISAVRTPVISADGRSPSRKLEYLKKTIITSAKRSPGPYTAPEVYENDGKNVGRNSDRWSYGCILVDVVASRMTGMASLEELTLRRGLQAEGSHSNDWYYRDRALNPEVQAWLLTLDTTHHLKDLADSAAFQECKKLLEELLVVDCNRPNGKIIRERLINAYKTIPVRESNPGLSLTRDKHGAEETQPIDLSSLEKEYQDEELAKISRLDRRAEADNMLLGKMQRWVLASQSQIFWIDTPLSGNIRPVPPICSNLLHVARENAIFVAAYFCRKDTGPGVIKGTKLDLLAELTYSLVYQLQSYMNGRPNPIQPVDQARFDALDGSKTLADAMIVLAELCASFPTRWFCIIDGFDLLEDVATKGFLQSLLRALRPSCEGDDPGYKSVCKTMITTCGRSTILGTLPVDYRWPANNPSGAGTQGYVVNKLQNAIEKLGQSSTL